MKYIITESKLNQPIYDFMDELFGTKIHTLTSLDVKGKELVGAYDFVNDEYYNNEGSDYLFGWTGEGYYNSLIKDGYIGETEWLQLQSESPVVEIFDVDAKNQLNGYFGNTWRPVFKQWFKDKTGMDYKTLYEVSN
jgi:hypothetical protein